MIAEMWRPVPEFIASAVLPARLFVHEIVAELVIPKQICLVRPY